MLIFNGDRLGALERVDGLLRKLVHIHGTHLLEGRLTIFDLREHYTSSGTVVKGIGDNSLSVIHDRRGSGEKRSGTGRKKARRTLFFGTLGLHKR